MEHRWLPVLMFDLKLSENVYLISLYQGEVKACFVYAGFTDSHDNSLSVNSFFRLNDHFIYSLEPLRATKENSFQLDFYANIFICSYTIRTARYTCVN